MALLSEHLWTFWPVRYSVIDNARTSSSVQCIQCDGGNNLAIVCIMARSTRLRHLQTHRTIIHRHPTPCTLHVSMLSVQARFVISIQPWTTFSPGSASAFASPGRTSACSDLGARLQSRIADPYLNFDLHLALSLAMSVLYISTHSSCENVFRPP